ncbi:MAG: hypothetical protein Q9227_004737 [Pyrenula ochraceoflavens]
MKTFPLSPPFLLTLLLSLTIASPTPLSPRDSSPTTGIWGPTPIPNAQAYDAFGESCNRHNHYKISGLDKIWVEWGCGLEFLHVHTQTHTHTGSATITTSTYTASTTATYMEHAVVTPQGTRTKAVIKPSETYAEFHCKCPMKDPHEQGPRQTGASR